MSVWRLVAREIAHRKGSFLLGVLCVALATATLVGGAALLRRHDLATRAVLDAAARDLDAHVRMLDDTMRRAMLRLGFNLVILPEGQSLGDWHADDYASKYMSVDSLDRIARARPVNSAHFVGVLRRKVVWPEKKRTIIVVGFGSEILHARDDARELRVPSVRRGEAHLGFEIHQGLGLKAGSETTLMGRSLRVGRCVAERGGPEDVTVWLNRDDAQELLGSEGRINEIHALATPEGLRDLSLVRTEMAGILPGTQVIARSAEVQANRWVRASVIEEGKATAERLARERSDMRAGIARLLLAVGAPVGFLACAWIVLSAMGNVTDRRDEIGILMAMGYRYRQVATACLLRFCLTGLAGGVAGVLVGVLPGMPGPGMLLGAICLATVGSCLAAWIPVRIATGRDPAAILRK